MIKEYFLSVVGACIVAGIAGLILPSKGTVGKYVNFLSSLIVVLSILLPLKNTISFLISIDQNIFHAQSGLDYEFNKYTENTNNIIAEKSSEIVCEAIQKELNEKLGIPSHECEIKLDLKTETGQVKIECVNVFLSGYSMWKDPIEVKETVSAFTGAECNVISG